MTLQEQLSPTEWKSKLAIMFIECTLFGVFVTLFIISTSLLVYRRNLSKMRSIEAGRQERFSLLVYLLLGLLMFFCLSGVWIFSWLRLLDPGAMGAKTDTLFVPFGHMAAVTETSPGALSPIVYGRGVLYISASKLSDMILTYRLWIVFRRSLRVIAFPCLIWVGYIVSCIALTVHYTIHKNISYQWLAGFDVLSICLNLYFTGLVLWKVRQTRQFVSYGGPNITKAMAIVIESAAIYTLWLVLFVCTFLIESPVVAGVIADGVAPVAGIVTMLVNVRVGLGTALGSSMGPHCPSSPESGLERWYMEHNLTTGITSSGAIH